MIGSQIKHYRIEKEIGRGGMGTVYLGYDLKLHRKVALKVLHPQMTIDENIRERFETEAIIQAKLNHSNIVSVYDYDAEKTTIVMEYVSGESLDKVIAKQKGPIPYKRCIEIFSQILKAISYAHNFRDDDVHSGVLHRDLKPSNIMVVHDIDQTKVKVMDFGIAKIVGDQRDRTGQDRMGTLAYMSPEQLKSTKDIGQQSDIYSLGVTLYEMATGQVPFDAKEEYDMMFQILSKNPETPRSLYSGITPAFEKVIIKAMAKSIVDRYQTCDDFLKELLTIADMKEIPKKPSKQTPSIIASGLIIFILFIFVILIIALSNRSNKNNTMNIESHTSTSYSQRTLPKKNNYPTPSFSDVQQNPPPQFDWQFHSSSITNDRSERHQPDAAFDSTDETTWCPYSSNVDEWLEVSFGGTFSLRSIGIQPGYRCFKWYENNRVNSARLEFSDGTNQNIIFTDSCSVQQFQIEHGPKVIDSLRIVITGITLGNRHNKTYIATVKINP